MLSRQNVAISLGTYNCSKKKGQCLERYQDTWCALETRDSGVSLFRLSLRWLDIKLFLKMFKSKVRKSLQQSVSNIQAIYTAEISFFLQTVNNLIRIILQRGYTLDMFSSSILEREEDMFKRRFRRPSKYFVRLQPWTETLVTNSPRSIETVCHVIHSINRVAKRAIHHLNKIQRGNRKRVCKKFFFPIL